MLATASSEFAAWIPWGLSNSKRSCRTNSFSSYAFAQAWISALDDDLHTLFSLLLCHDKTENSDFSPFKIRASAKIVTEPPCDAPSYLLAWLASEKVITTLCLIWLEKCKPTEDLARWRRHNLLHNNNSLTVPLWLLPWRMEVVADSHGAVWLARQATAPKRPFMLFFSGSVAFDVSSLFLSCWRGISFKPKAYCSWPNNKQPSFVWWSSQPQKTAFSSPTCFHDPKGKDFLKLLILLSYNYLPQT